MKNIKLFEEYHFSKDQIENMILKAQKRSEIELKVDIDDLLDNLKSPEEDRFGFNAFVREEGRFISFGDQERMGEYIEKFKQLGLDTSKVEKLYPSIKIYYKNTLRDFNRELDKRMDLLQPLVKEFENEIRILAKKANEL